MFEQFTVIPQSVNFLASSKDTETVYHVDVTGLNSQYLELEISQLGNERESTNFKLDLGDQWYKLTDHELSRIRSDWFVEWARSSRVKFLPLNARFSIFGHLIDLVNNDKEYKRKIKL